MKSVVFRGLTDLNRIIDTDSTAGNDFKPVSMTIMETSVTFENVFGEIPEIDSSLEGYFENAKNWFKSLIDHNFKLKIEMEKEIHEMESSILAAIETINECGPIDENVFGETHLNCYHINAFIRDMKGYERLTGIIAGGHLLKSIENIENAIVKNMNIGRLKELVVSANHLTQKIVADKTVSDSLGIKAVLSDGDESIRYIDNDQHTIFRSEGTSHALGWKASSVKKLLADCKVSVIPRLHNLVGHFNDFNRVISAIVEKSVAHEDPGMLHYSIKHLEPLMTCQRMLYDVANELAKMLIKTAVQVSKVAVKAAEPIKE